MKKKYIKNFTRRKFSKLALSTCFVQFIFAKRLSADGVFKISEVAPIKLAVSKLEVADYYRIPFSEPFVEHRMRRSPSSAISGWAHTVLRPEGLDGIATLSIEEASAEVTSIGSENTIFDIFKNNQSSKIKIILSGKLEIEKKRTGQSGYVKITATSTQTAPEAASLNQLEKIWDISLNTAIGKFDSEFRKQILSLSEFLL